jgi:hypothetical protein
MLFEQLNFESKQNTEFPNDITLHPRGDDRMMQSVPNATMRRSSNFDVREIEKKLLLDYWRAGDATVIQYVVTAKAKH